MRAMNEAKGGLFVRNLAQMCSHVTGFLKRAQHSEIQNWRCNPTAIPAHAWNGCGTRCVGEAASLLELWWRGWRAEFAFSFVHIPSSTARVADFLI